MLGRYFFEMGWAGKAGKAGKSYVFLPILVAKCLENRHCFHDFWLEFIFQFCGNPVNAVDISLFGTSSRRSYTKIGDMLS